MQNKPENFQYDSCISKGICSVNPRTASLIIVLITFLRLTAKYCLKLCRKEKMSPKIKELILNTTAIAVSGQEFTEQSFTNTLAKFKKFLPEIIEQCHQFDEQDEFKNEKITSSELFVKTESIIDSIKLGDRIFRTYISAIPTEIRDLHQIILVISKSLSINLIDLESFGEEFEDGFMTILELINSIDAENHNYDKLKNTLHKAVRTNNLLMKKLRSTQEARYGKQIEQEVSYTTTSGKAVLVAGSNIMELETILEALKNTEIAVYTHDDMMTAHTFPNFSKYKNLKGQFGQGIENCLTDFATFPGPIILTKHSLHNIDNLYRGRLFTTDFTVPQGVIKIENNDFTDVIESARSARGFKRGKICETVAIGFDFDKTVDNIKSKLKNKNRIFLIGLEKYSPEQKVYFEKLIKFAPENTLIISFSYNFERENLIHINTCFDSYSLIRIFDAIEPLGFEIVVFMPKCDKNTISEMIYLSEHKNTRVFVGKCTPILLNPSLMQTLTRTFNIHSITSAKKDLEDIS